MLNIDRKKKMSTRQTKKQPIEAAILSIGAGGNQNSTMNFNNCTFTNLQYALSVSYSNVTVTNTHFSNVYYYGISNSQSYWPNFYSYFVMQNCSFTNVSNPSNSYPVIQFQSGPVRKKKFKEEKSYSEPHNNK